MNLMSLLWFCHGGRLNTKCDILYQNEVLASPTRRVYLQQQIHCIKATEITQSKYALRITAVVPKLMIIKHKGFLLL